MTYNDKREELIRQIKAIHNTQGHAAIGIDGRCTSGKSTIAEYIAEELNAILIHMDDFFLRPEQRTPERYATPGANVDYERFMEEVLTPLQKGESFAYRPFDCVTMSLMDPINVPASSIVIIEGSYCMRPELRPFYDLKVFMDVDAEIQMQRLHKRNPDKVEDFRTKWIPYEEKYHQAYNVRELCDLVIDTTDFF